MLDHLIEWWFLYVLEIALTIGYYFFPEGTIEIIQGLEETINY